VRGVGADLRSDADQQNFEGDAVDPSRLHRHACTQGISLNPRLDSLRPFLSLQESLPALLACLRATVPMRLWMVGRLAGNAWTVIQADDLQARVKPGDSFPWPDTLCVRVLEHYGCCFAEDTAADPILAAAPARTAMKIGAYIGYPVLSWRGELLGTVCAIDPAPQPPFSEQQRQVVEKISRTISTLVAHSFKLDESRRSEQRARTPVNLDHQTGLPNLAGWQILLEEEEMALRLDDEDAMVAVVDIAMHGGSARETAPVDWDEALMRHGHLLKTHVRGRDAVARTGLNRFSLLLRGLGAEQGRAAVDKIRQALQESGANAALGYAMRRGSGSLAEAARIADIRMYNDRLAMKGQGAV
jgi:GAF domain-containing protein